ncbi:MAG: hypothetical protein AAB583_00170 [Patescibacteria group bacterium]
MQKPDNSRVITILGSTGELGSQAANYLIKNQKYVLLVFRKGYLGKLKRSVKLNAYAQILGVSTLFNKKLLNRIQHSSKIIFNLAGLVSLSFSEKVYPHVLLINGFFPGLLVQSKRKLSAPIVYASTQRMKILTQKHHIKWWISEAIREFNTFINKTNIKTNLEDDILAFTKKFLLNHPVPSDTNIYELSKALGEAMLQQSNNSIILSISSCYGPGCSIRRTVGRLIFSRLLGQEATEKEEVRDFLYIEDLNEIFKKLINFSPGKPYIRYCCSGTNTSKSYIITKITEKTPNESGVLKTLGSNDIEIFKPSGRWLKNTLKRNPIRLNDGLAKTIKNVKKLYFSKNPRATIERLSALYDRIKQKTDEQGIDPQEVEEIRSSFFRYHNGKWQAEEAFWKPTGLVLGYPFAEPIGSRFISFRSKILAELGLKPYQYWLPDEDLLHMTIISYSHYSESGMNIILLPETEIPKAREIIGNYRPIKISFRGGLITNNGSLLIKGFVEDEDLFLLRSELMAKIDGITQQPQNLAHVKLAQILEDVPYELTEKVNRLYSSLDLGFYVFSDVKTPQRELLRF